MTAISKGEFARRRNVSPGRVSQWISEGKISGAAIVGEGRAALIDEAVACAQLDRALHVDQRFGNGLKTTIAAASPAPEIEIPPASSSVTDQIALQRLEQLQRANRQGMREEAVANGRLVDAAEARQVAGRETARLLTRLEGSLADFATAVAAQFKLPQRDVLHTLRQEMRKVRAAAAIEVRERAEPLPETVGHELADP